jgi:Ca2+-binding RTX toxin-like protein
MANILGNNGNNELYGTNFDDLIDGGIGADKMYGYGGADTYVVDNIGDQVIETEAGAAGGIDLVKSSVSFTLGANLENLTLNDSANINGTGNELDNVTTGNDGNNVLDGAGGNDTLNGGKGDDTYIVDSTKDKVVENIANAASGGIDTVKSTVSFSLAALANVENLTLLGKMHLDATGNALDNKLAGNDGANELDGGQGADTMAGGKGGDTYFVDNVGDLVKEKAGEGDDTIVSTVAIAAPVAHVENYTFNVNTAIQFTGNADTAWIDGGTGNDTLTSGGLINIMLNGEAGDDTLIGSSKTDRLHGGTGADLMIGGDGGDYYWVDNVKDKVQEAANQGIDLVYSSVNIDKLAANVEKLQLTDKALIGTGNELDNVIAGTSGDNVLDGGTGKDILIGGEGNDTYIIDNSDDGVYENKNGGIDLVKSAVSFKLDLWAENLTLTGNKHINAEGNEYDNVLTGNDGNNLIDGHAGKDAMNGGKGDDFYGVDDAGDTVTETLTGAQGGGKDRVYSAIDFALGANLEGLQLTGTALKGTGNELDNELAGNALANILDGGKGADVMSGVKGDDTYYVDSALDVVKEKAGEGIDTVISTVALAAAIDQVECYIFKTSEAVSFIGSAHAERIEGGTGSDTLNGGGGGDALYGQAGDDTLTGGKMTDWLYGGDGADTMTGGTGDDIYYVDNVNDVVVEYGGQDTDRAFSTVSVTKLWDNVEILALQGSDDLNATGNALGNTLWGNVGNNVLDGAAGADILYGGEGDDTYVIDNVNDHASEAFEDGIDTVKTTLSGYALEANVENLILVGNGMSGIGNAMDNTITGTDGADTLNGGKGNDTLIGGNGNDTYYVDNVGDKIVESGGVTGGGVDSVWSSIGYSLEGLGSVEKLYLTGVFGSNATGNALDNYIGGTAGDDIIDGGQGADWMEGGKGNDTYYVDNQGDLAFEKPGEGHDTVISTVALTSTIFEVEDYTFNTSGSLNLKFGSADNVIHAGSGADVIAGGGGFDKLYGGGGDDALTGGSKSDYLDGEAGADILTGGGGSDTYIVDNAKDTILELFNQGDDQVLSSVTIAKLWDNVEYATLTGDSAINLTANDLNNGLFGNAGNNVIDGGGGKDFIVAGFGDDTLRGGSGADTFYFAVTANDGHDTIKDFVKAEDILYFETGDLNGDGKVNILDLTDSVGSIVDEGGNVDVVFDNGAVITFAGVGTGAVDSFSDLVANVVTQIQVV